MNKKQLIVMWVIISIFITLVFLSEAQAASYKTVIFQRNGDSYVVDVKYPEIANRRLGPDVRQSINKEIEQFVHKLFDDDFKTFIEDGSQWTKEELKKIAGRDSVGISFEVIRLDEHFVSIRFEKYSYGIGAAHGLTHIAGFNYDIKQMKQIKLGDLFEAGTDYLKQISDYCIQDLGRQLGGEMNSWIKEGAAPEEEKFKDFTLDKEGLIIYFSDYQIAGYATGIRQVKIPFNRLLNLK